MSRRKTRTFFLCLMQMVQLIARKQAMKRITIFIAFAYAAALALSPSEAEKKCFEKGNQSFAQKTKDVLVLYGDKKNPKVSLVKYVVKNNPQSQDGYSDQSFYMIDIPKVVYKSFAVESWNDFLCGNFFPQAYPNVNELTTIRLKGETSSVTWDDKNYYFRAMDYDRGLNTPEAMDSFSVSIPGNLVYSKYPIGKIYSNEYVEKMNKKIFQENKMLAEFADGIFNVFGKKDFEERKDYLEFLKKTNFGYVETVEKISKAIDEFDDVRETNANTDAYGTVYPYLKKMNDKFESVRPYMTSNSAAFAEAVRLFFQDFEKQSNRYLKKIKTKKNKETEKNLADYTKESLQKAIEMIQRGIERLGYSGDESDRKIAYILNDYEEQFTKLLKTLDSGNIGSSKFANVAISAYLTEFTLLFDMMGSKKSYKGNEDANNTNSNAITVDDGSTLALYGKIKDEKDYRLLVKTKSTRISSLFFDDEGFKGALVDGERFVFKNYLPPIQVVFAGEGHNLVLYGNEASMLNESTFPERKSYATKKGIEYLEKLKCVFTAVQMDLKKYKEFVGTETMDRGSMSFIKKNDKFQSLSCTNGAISIPTVEKAVISPDAKLKIKKIPNQKVVEGKYSESLDLSSFVESSSCQLNEIKWTAKRTKHLYAMIYISNETKVKADEGWCGREEIVFTAKTSKGEITSVPVLYTVECAH